MAIMHGYFLRFCGGYCPLRLTSGVSDGLGRGSEIGQQKLDCIQIKPQRGGGMAPTIELT